MSVLSRLHVVRSPIRVAVTTNLFVTSLWWGVHSVPFGKLPFSPSGQRRWPERQCTTARPGEGERSRSLVGRLESAYLHAAAKLPCSAEQPLAHKGTLRFGRSTSRHDTTKMIHLHWGATRARLRRGGRLPRLLEQPRRSGDHPPVHPLERCPCSSGGSELLELRGGQIGL
jgi:hypothetical protein